MKLVISHPSKLPGTQIVIFCIFQYFVDHSSNQCFRIYKTALKIFIARILTMWNLTNMLNFKAKQ
jgi:hypothetical protein